MRGQRIEARIFCILILVSLLATSIAAAAPSISAGTLATGNLRSFEATYDPDGYAWAVWEMDEGTDTEIYFSRETRNGWQPPDSISRAPTTLEYGPSLAFDSDGVAWVAWSASYGVDDGEIVVKRWMGHGWSQLTEIPGTREKLGRWPVLASAPGGQMWLAWVGFDGTDDEIYVSRWNGHIWSAPYQVSHDEADPLAYDAQPRLQVDSSGRAWLVWVKAEALYDDEIYASQWNGASWSAPERVNTDDGQVDTWPTLVVDAEGRPWVAWQGVVDVDAAARWRIYITHWDPQQSAWQGESMVSSAPSLPIDETQASLSFDAQGHPYLAWIVSGEATGLAYTYDDGSGWREPYWALADTAVAHYELSTFDEPWLFWWDPDDLLPRQRRLVTENAPVPVSVPEAPAPLSFPQSTYIHRFMAFGDSITWGQYVDPATGQPVGPYPERLETKLKTRVVPSEVFNVGLPGERTRAGRDRIGVETTTYDPDYILILEGTNDLTAGVTCNNIVANLSIMIDVVRGHKPMLSTLTPRLDSLNNQVTACNPYIAGAAVDKGVPLADNWQAYINYGNWSSLLMDHVHPNAEGMRVMTDTWYDALQDAYWWLTEETEPPTTWIESLPIQTELGQPGTVTWTGTDNLSWVVDYDVQVQANYGPWIDWHMATQNTSAPYVGNTHGTVFGFRVRGRDVVGNESVYSAAKYTTIVDQEPPTTWIESLPIQTACGQLETVTWTGTDNSGWVADYDVQIQTNYGPWIDWHMATQSTSAPYVGNVHGTVFGFRVRGRDVVGNQSVYSAARYTTIVDRDPPYDVWISPLEPVLKPPFEIRWSGADACSQVSRFEVEVRIGPTGDWILWQVGTHTSAVFGDNEPVQYGQTYYFRVRAYDAADNWAESLPVSTVPAQYTLDGSVLNARHERIAGADAWLIPAAPAMKRQPGGYLAYLAQGGIYELLAEREGFGILPSIHLSVAADMSGVDMILPPLDNVVSDGDFEPGAWNGWQAGGTLTPALTSDAHTGSGAALLGGLGELSWLRQSFIVPADLTNPTLSFLIRLDDDAAGSSTVQIELEGTPISYTHVVGAGDWSHVWLPVNAAVGQPATLTFTLSDTAAVRLDEVSLGSALSGGHFPNLPLVLRHHD
jgi:acyl-CoA thioesterase-1